MDKEYLIHNIDYKDNPEDQHQTIDITISDLEVDQDITATIGIDTYVNGILTNSNKYEDVSLTGAGGGGQIEYDYLEFTYDSDQEMYESVKNYGEIIAGYSTHNYAIIFDEEHFPYTIPEIEGKPEVPFVLVQAGSFEDGADTHYILTFNICEKINDVSIIPTLQYETMSGEEYINIGGL